MDMKEPLIKANRVFKYSITFQETNDESREVSDFSDSGFIIENETDEIGDILKLAQQTYGIYYPISFGGWESTTPEHNAKYFEKGIETYYALFIKNEDGTDITEEEYDFITFLLSDGNYNKSEFTDYAVGGVVLGALALGVGGLIAYYYFNKRKKGYPTGSAWTKEHYHDNEDEDYEVEPSKRKVPARNRKYDNGGDVREMDWYKGFKKTRPFEMIVVTKEAEKDGGNEIIFNVIVEAQNDTLAYQEARKKWQMENELSDLSIVKVYTKEEYVNSKKMNNGGGVGQKIYLENPYNENGGFIVGIAKDNISEIMNHVSFRKFGNEFRKHIDSYFTQENNIERVNKGISWSELASYIVGDGDYDVEQEQYENFIKSFNTTYTKNEYKGGGGVEYKYTPYAFVYREIDDPDFLPERLSPEEVKEFIENFNEDFDTNYKDWQEFNKGEEYRKFEAIMLRERKFNNGGTTTTRPTTKPEVVPDTDTKPPKTKEPYKPKHTPLIKPKARKYDFILIKK